LQAEEHTTKPPARFTEATLVKELEAQGIGRPSTYASIINKIVQRDYVEIKKGTLVPTFLAVAVTQLLENHFEPLVDTQFTAQMEDNLDAISRGELKPKPFMKQFYFGDDQIRGLADMLQEKIDIAAACTINVAADSIPFLDADGSATRIESIADLATAMAGTNLTASSGQLVAGGAGAGLGLVIALS